MLDGILAETEKVGAGYRVRMLSIADGVCLLDDARPGPCGGACNYRLVGPIRRDDLELRTVAAVENSTMIHNFNIRIQRGEISSSMGKAKP